MGSADLLTWSPPPLAADAVTFNVSGGNGNSTVYNAGGKDAFVNITGVITSRLIIRSARNVRLIGGEINIGTAWSNSNERWGLYFQDCSGIVHVEGLLIHGLQLIEGIDLGQVTPGQATSPYPDVLQIQNCRIAGVRDPDGAFHGDCVQCWGGVDALRLDKVTMSSQYQNLLFKSNYNRGGTADVRRTDMAGFGAQQEFYLKTTVGGVNVAGNPHWEGPVTWGGDGSYEQRAYATRPAASKPGADFGHAELGRVCSPTVNYTGSNPAIPAGERPSVGVEDGRRYLHWPTSGDGANPRHAGRLWEGPRPEGDWCPAGVPGMGYASPGYLPAAGTAQPPAADEPAGDEPDRPGRRLGHHRWRA